MSFSLTSSGLTYTNSNNITKHIVIDDNTNTIDFQQFNISAVSVSNKEYVENSIDPHLVSYWPLTSITNGTTPDIINGYDMDVVNMDATNIVTGRTVGSLAFSFDSQSSTVLSRTDTAIHPLPIGKQTDYTISYWLKMIVTGTHFSFTNTGNDGLLVAKHDGNPFHTYHGNSTQGSHLVSSSAGYADPADGSWHHVSLTKSAGYIYKIYIDGVLTKTHSHGHSIILDVDTTLIGGMAVGNGHMDGEMSEVAVWKRALSASEVSQLALGTAPDALVVGVDINGAYSDTPWWSGGVFSMYVSSDNPSIQPTIAAPNGTYPWLSTFVAPEDPDNSGNTVSVSGNRVTWVSGEKTGQAGTFANNVITWDDGNTWERS